MRGSDPKWVSSTLALFVLGIAADDENDTVAADDFTVVAHAFDGRSDFHGSTPKALSESRRRRG